MHIGCGRFALALFIAAAACSDDGVPANGTDGATGDGSQSGPTSVTDTASASDPTATGSVSATGGDSTGGATASAGETTGSTSTSTGADSSSGGSTSGETGTPATPCVDDGDCTLFQDCCSCMAVGVDDMPPGCDLACDQPLCDAAGVGNNVQCELGACTLEEVTCNQQFIACDDDPPTCPVGWLPSIDNDCWSGLCVPADACDVVPSCEDCPDDQICVPLLAKGPAGFRCSPVAPACDGTPDCTCMDGVCPEFFSACIETDGGVQCECPNC